MGQQASTLARPAAVERGAERPARGARDRLDTTTRALGIATAVAMPVMLALVFLYAPPERTQGQAQRIFYPHFGAALVMYLAAALLALLSIAMVPAAAGARAVLEERSACRLRDLGARECGREAALRALPARPAVPPPHDDLPLILGPRAKGAAPPP